MKRAYLGQLDKRIRACMKAACVISLLAAMALGGEKSDSTTDSPVARPIRNSSNLENVLLVGDGIYSGSEPVKETDYQWLADQGIQTLVSVDRVPPNVELARQFGLRYVHIPIGYGQIERKQQLAIVRAIRETDKSIYFHCHRGQHRGPAATALACIAAEIFSHNDGSQFLKLAGTSRHYQGLWDSVQNFVSPSRESELPELEESVVPAPLAESMAQIDRAWREIEKLSRKNWQPIGARDVEQVRLLGDGLRVSGRHASDEFDDEFRRMMSQAAEHVSRLENALERGNSEQAGREFGNIRENCQQCHERFRD